MNFFARGATLALRMTSLPACLLLVLCHRMYAQSTPLHKVWLKQREWGLYELRDSLRSMTGYPITVVLDTGQPEPRFIAGADGEPLNLFLTSVSKQNSLQWRQDHLTIIITVIDAPKLLAAASVKHLLYNTGYHEQPIDTPTGSVVVVEQNTLGLTVSSAILDHLENNVSGLLFNHGGKGSDGTALPTQPIIRGLSTIYSNPSIQYVLDKALYSGNPLNINPEDFESVTVEKDAASTGLYGVRAGNGVIVFTTKRGKTPTPLLEYSSNMTWQGRPNFDAIHSIAASDEISFERSNYALGNYPLGTISHPAPLPPVVYLLNAAANGELPPAVADARIDALAKVDSRQDISRYLYSNSLMLREHVDISGASAGHSYYFGFGYDHQPSALAASNYDRYTFRMNNSFVFDKHWSADADAGFTLGVQSNGDNPGVNYRSLHGGRAFPTYQRLVGDKGNPMPVFTDYNPDFLRDMSRLGYIDQYYRPVADIPQELNRVQTNDYTFSGGLRYRPGPWGDFEANYSVEDQTVQDKDVFSPSAYFVRDLQNTFAQRDSLGNFSFPIPGGGIETVTNSDLVANQVRLQFNLHPYWNINHRLTALAGTELRSEVNTGYSFRYYGFDGGISSVNSMVNFNVPYPSYLTGQISDIPNPQSISRTTDHFLSGYLEAMYVDHQQLYVTVTLRKDAANLFGVRTNQKAMPLWSGGLGYELDSLPFYHWQAVPQLKLRLSYGVNGNFDRQASAYTIASYSNTSLTTSLPNATILSPPNNDLRWEQVAQFDGGLDFTSRNRFLSGTFDYYLKSSSDLIGEAPLDPTLGLISNAGSPAFFYGNVAAMRGYGLDCQLTARWIRPEIARPRKMQWYTVFLLSQTVTKVTRYFLPTGAGNAYLNPNLVNPVPGRPLYPVYSYRWAGLDPGSGDPRAYYNGRPSSSWDSIWSNTTLNGMAYKGSSQPVWYGSLRNTVEWNNWGLTALVSFKGDYYCRRPSISYGDLVTVWTGNSDYARRWQHPGDERLTNVPSAVYYADPSRDNVYTYSSALVDRADNIRLEDIRISRDLEFGPGKTGAKRHQLSLYADAANLGVIWKANKDGIDPFYINTPRDNRRWSVGFKGTF
jgi:TonB-dependent starch-binding outer membrane protein SusC